MNRQEEESSPTVNRDEGFEITPRGRQLPEKYTIHRGIVVSVKNFGAFVRLDGTLFQGLLHVSEISKRRIEDANDRLAKDDIVWVKVINVDDDRLSLSMKHVEQGHGEDLDPNNAEHEFEKTHRQPYVPAGTSKISLEAALNRTLCEKCGAAGHLAASCFTQNGEKYDILADEDDIELDLDSIVEPPKKKHGKKRRNKEYRRAPRSRSRTNSRDRSRSRSPTPSRKSDAERKKSKRDALSSPETRHSKYHRRDIDIRPTQRKTDCSDRSHSFQSSRENRTSTR